MDNQSNDSRDPQTSRDDNREREGVLDWDKYFMAMAFVAAMRSKDPRTKVGACIVNPAKRIVGVGYNGAPNGYSDDVFPWEKPKKPKLESKSFYVCHAELNAIMNKYSADVKNCTMYVGLFPCNECAKIIIQSGITEVVYVSDKKEHKNKTKAAKRMFEKALIKCRQYIPDDPEMKIDFTVIDRNRQN